MRIFLEFFFACLCIHTPPLPPKHTYTQFLQQYHHYQSLLQLFLINPSQQSERLEELVMFLSQVSMLGVCMIKNLIAEIKSH